MHERFSAMCEADVKGGRPSIAPEKLVRAMLLQVLYSVRSERQLVEQNNYNLLLRWFVGLSIEDAVWNHSVFSKNRERMIEHDVVIELFNAAVNMARAKDLRLGEQAPALLSLLGHIATDNRHALVVNVETTKATGTAERDAAAAMLGEMEVRGQHIPVRADEAYDTRGFVRACRKIDVTPHVAQNVTRRGGSAIDGRTTRHVGYEISQGKRKRIEQCFGWAKTVGPMRHVMLRRLHEVNHTFTLTMAAYNLIRLRNLADSVA